MLHLQKFFKGVHEMKKFIKKMLFLMVLLFSTIFAAKATDTDSPQPAHLIPIAMATDNNYVYPTIVAMTSVLETKKDDTLIDFNIMISGKVDPENKLKLKKLEKLYKNCSVELIDMEKVLSQMDNIPPSMAIPTFYRLAMPSVFQKYDKIIYLDGDTAVAKDLWDMFSIDLEDNYIGGGLDAPIIKAHQTTDYATRLGMDSIDSYINAGVLLMDLKKLREDNMEKVFYEFIPELKTRKLRCKDQDTLNSTCYGKIKILPKEYNLFSKYYVAELTDAPLSENQSTDPTIIHFAGRAKPWRTTSTNAYKIWEKYNEIALEKIYDGKNPYETIKKENKKPTPNIKEETTKPKTEKKKKPIQKKQKTKVKNKKQNGKSNKSNPTPKNNKKQETKFSKSIFGNNEFALC